ncbi:MAG: type II toxin-antitoxin system ParD family antitoxin [Tepidisphaeraceae bacterium]|jgi:antitoxin ParD1/3/4
MNVSLKPDVQKYVEEKVKTGQYASPEEAVNNLLQQSRQREELTVDDIEELRREIDVGINEADNGQFADFDAEDVIAQRHAGRKKTS